MYFHKRPMSADPFTTFGKKRAVYHDFFRRGTALGFDMFIASGKEHYRHPLTFENAYRYDMGHFVEYGPIEADAVYDRSGGMTFPPETIGMKTLNSIAFKRLCNDKNAMERVLGKFMPKNFPVMDQESLSAGIRSLGACPLAVLKPAKGMQGKGIVIDSPTNLSTITLEEGVGYCLQEFIDTSKGIPGIVSGYHDLRIIIVDGEIVLCHVRTPKEGSLLANVAQGGSIREVPLEIIPAVILRRVADIQARIDKQFDFPIYSIDFGIQNAVPFVFELNDQIGFPSEEMHHEPFLTNLIQSLWKRAQRTLL
jgi:glutathione synthase/RimK-type ligase-like ATP-grasp enzyme